MRIGHGYDVHPLVEGRELIMGGVAIPHSTGLLGHSDADVLVHAIADAILGAAALGDIGQHFPDSDSKWQGVSSLIILSQCGNLLLKSGYKLVNLDSVIIAEKPKLAPYLESMRKNIAKALGLDTSQIGIKATTTEKLGFCGREEGIAASAVVLITEL